MSNLRHKPLSIILIVTTILSISACSSGLSKLRGLVSDDGGVDYQNNQAVKKLEVPPDLTQPEFDSSFELPTGVISAVSLKNGTAMPQTATSPSDNSNTGAVRRGDLSSVKTVAGKTVLQINDTYPRSLVITEIMLSRMGFSTVSKSAGGDVITAKYNGSNVTVDGKRKGFFSKAKSLVGLGKNDNVALKNGASYRFAISNEQDSPIVRVSALAGGVLSDAAHAKIITLLNTAFNK